MKCVIDSSLALSCCFTNEYTSASQVTYLRIRENVLVVPPFCDIEIANILGLCFKKGRLDTESLGEPLDILRSLRIETVPVHLSADIPALMRTMHAHDLTSYYVLYVDLAIQPGLPLGTLDRQMARSARAAGISLILEPVN